MLDNFCPDALSCATVIVLVLCILVFIIVGILHLLHKPITKAEMLAEIKSDAAKLRRKETP
jgi:hypothetical protein